MTIGPESRYLDAQRVFTEAHRYSVKRATVTGDTDEPIRETRDTLFLFTTVVEDTDSSDTVVTNELDRFDTLAYKWLGSSERWWRIADLNPHVGYPLDIRYGLEVVIPE